MQSVAGRRPRCACICVRRIGPTCQLSSRSLGRPETALWERRSVENLEEHAFNLAGGSDQHRHQGQISTVAMFAVGKD